jgi:hypothetical protein
MYNLLWTKIVAISKKRLVRNQGLFFKFCHFNALENNHILLKPFRTNYWHLP